MVMAQKLNPVCELRVRCRCELADCDIRLRDPEEPFPAYAAIREELLHFGVVQKAEM